MKSETFGSDPAGANPVWYAALNRFKFEVQRCWHKWLNRRNRHRELLWFRFNALLRRYSYDRWLVSEPFEQRTVIAIFGKDFIFDITPD